MISIVLRDKNNKIISSSTSNSFLELEQIISKLPISKSILKAFLFIHQREINYLELSRLKISLLKFNIILYSLTTNNRKSHICAKSMKINSFFDTNLNLNLLPEPIVKETDSNLTHFGVIRSGEKISSNGDLIIIGDVNPGAQISAKRNIYVWGKLCGVAIAGENGQDKCTISSLYLNPLQLRINTTIAIGPQEKPSYNYPEIASLNSGKIVIKPLIINN